MQLALSSLAGLSAIPSGKYTLDEFHGYITFSYSHFGFSTPHVGFDKFDLTLHLGAKNPQQSTLEVLIDASGHAARRYSLLLQLQSAAVAGRLRKQLYSL